MSVPENMRAFDLQKAISGHNICTRDGRKAKFIAYVPECDKYCQVLALIGNEVYDYATDGKYHYVDEPQRNDLFLAPLGMCEGKPVWPGDILTNKHGNLSWTVLIGAEADTIAEHFWPKPKHTVETRMTLEEIGKVYNNATSVKDIANKAIERSIADGDVIPTSVVEELVVQGIKSFSDNMWTHAKTAKLVVQEYKEQLK